MSHKPQARFAVGAKKTSDLSTSHNVCCTDSGLIYDQHMLIGRVDQ